MHEKHTMDQIEVANGKGCSAGARMGTSRPMTMRVGRVLVVRCVSNALKLEMRYERVRGRTTSTTRSSRETRSKGTMTKLRGKGESDTIRNVLRRRKRTMTNTRNA